MTRHHKISDRTEFRERRHSEFTTVRLQASAGDVLASELYDRFIAWLPR